LQIQKRRKEVIPLPVESEDGTGDQRGHDHGQNDSGEDTVFGAAVDIGGFIQVARYALDKLVDQEYEKWISEKRRDDQRTPGIDPTKELKHDILRNRKNLRGQQQRDDDASEQRFFKSELNAGKTICHQSRGKDLPQCGGYYNKE
jgi:hypothetical protein